MDGDRRPRAKEIPVEPEEASGFDVIGLVEAQDQSRQAAGKSGGQVAQGLFAGLMLLGVGWFVISMIFGVWIDEGEIWTTLAGVGFVMGLIGFLGFTVLTPAETQPVTVQRVGRRAVPSHVKQAVFARDGGSCVACGSVENLQYDHVIPHSKGGGDQIENLQILCGPCNRRKAARIE